LGPYAAFTISWGDEPYADGSVPGPEFRISAKPDVAGAALGETGIEF
jgi:hypothetical protein